MAVSYAQYMYIQSSILMLSSSQPAQTPTLSSRSNRSRATSLLKLLLLSEEHSETYNGAVDQQTANYAHDHCFDTDQVRVGKDDWESCDETVSDLAFEIFTSYKTILTNAHNDQESSQESPQFHYARAATVHEIIVLLGFAAQPVGYRGENVGCDDEKGEVVLEEGGAEDH